jgi:hypothetical protein
MTDGVFDEEQDSESGSPVQKKKRQGRKEVKQAAGDELVLLHFRSADIRGVEVKQQLLMGMEFFVINGDHKYTKQQVSRVINS